MLPAHAHLPGGKALRARFEQVAKARGVAEGVGWQDVEHHEAPAEPYFDDRKLLGRQSKDSRQVARQYLREQRVVCSEGLVKRCLEAQGVWRRRREHGRHERIARQRPALPAHNVRRPNSEDASGGRRASESLENPVGGVRVRQ